MQKSIFKTISVLALTLVLMCGGITAAAASADNAYTYDSWGNTLDVPSGYEEEFSFDESDGIKLKSPMDMYYRNGLLYVLDSGNGRIVVYDESYNFVKKIDRFYTEDDKQTELNEPQGIFVTSDGRIVIADTANARV